MRMLHSRGRRCIVSARLASGIVCGAVLLLTVAPAPGADRQAGPATLKEVRDLLDEASVLLTDGKAAKAADKTAEAARRIGELSRQERMPSGLRSLWEKCRSIKNEIALEGIDVDRIDLPPLAAGGGKGSTVAPAAAKPAAAKPAAPMPTGKAAPAAVRSTGFTGQVAPILAKHCGGCHIAGRKGGFQMASYAGLMKTGMVQPGAGEASRLVEVILSGDMPRGGGKVSPDEVGVLMRWIDAGAPFDGPDPAFPLDALARQVAAAAQQSPPKAMPVKLKEGEVSFAADVAPVLLEHCAGCHDATNPESNLSMATLERLLRGGRGGPPLVAGKGADSLLVKKIKGAGIEGQRMPLGKDPLPDAVIATIQAWVDQGLKLDMLTPKDDLGVVAAAGRARTLTHESLRPVRFEAAKRLWARAIPDERPTAEERGDVMVFGNLSGTRMKSLADQAEAVGSRLRDDVAGGAPIVKGGVVVYAFAKSYDFSSFWQAVFADERPKGVSAGAGITGDVVYAAFAAAADDAEDVADATAALTEQMAAAALLGRGAPGWFARGCGRALATKAAPKSALVQKWRRELPEAMQRMGTAADVLDGRALPQTTAAVAGGFVAPLLATGGRLPALVKQLDGGVGFDQAFQSVFRGPPRGAFEAWCAQQQRSGRK